MTVYVPNAGSGTVTPIRAATNAAGPAILIGGNPLALAITPNGKTAYVVNGRSDTVTPISIAAGKAGKAITTGKDPFAIAISPGPTTRR